MLAKEKLINSIENMPDKFSLEEVIERIVSFKKLKSVLNKATMEKFIQQRRRERNLKNG